MYVSTTEAPAKSISGLDSTALGLAVYASQGIQTPIGTETGTRDGNRDAISIDGDVLVRFEFRGHHTDY